MLKSNILTSLELLADRKKSAAGKRQSTPAPTPTPPTPTPTPNPSPELPQPTSTPTVSSVKPGQMPDLPDEVSSTRRDELFRLMNGYYDRQTQSAETSRASTTNQRGKVAAVPGVIKPADQVDTGSQIMMTDGGKAGTSSNGLIYNPATGQSTATGKPSNEPSAITVSPTAGIPDDYADLAEIVATLPDFDFSGWDDMTAKQQLNALQKSGLSSEDMMTLLNSATSLETIATVQDIQTYRVQYGLTKAEADSICAQLFEITNARIGAKTHALPFSSNARMTRMFLDDLDGKEEALLASFGYGIVSADGTDASDNGRPELPPSLNDDASGIALLYEGGDINVISDGFFEYVGNIDQIRQDIESGDITFNSEAQKLRYLDYLDDILDENESLYRRQLAEYVDGTKLKKFPSERFKSLINELSIEQLRVFADHIDEVGLKKLARSAKFENLMKDVLSDKNSAMQIVADDAHSPICPYIWEGTEIAEEEGVQISGYYYENGTYKTLVSIDGYDSVEIPLDTSGHHSLPTDVGIRISRADSWDMVGKQIGLGIETALPFLGIISFVYGGLVVVGIIYDFLAGYQVYEVPALSEALGAIDIYKNVPHLEKGTVVVTAFIDHNGKNQNDMASKKFYPQN
jgi:hypothetical protein